MAAKEAKKQPLKHNNNYRNLKNALHDFSEFLKPWRAFYLFSNNS